MHSRLEIDVPTFIIRRKDISVEVQVSPEDLHLVFRYAWHIITTGYVSAKTNKSPRKTLLLHRLIMKCPDGLVVDHIDRDPLNNLRENLRICTTSDNNYNQSKQTDTSSAYRGVCWDTNSGKWLARIKLTGDMKQLHIGSFDTEVAAAKAYDMYARIFRSKTQLNNT